MTAQAVTPQVTPQMRRRIVLGNIQVNALDQFTPRVLQPTRPVMPRPMTPPVQAQTPRLFQQPRQLPAQQPRQRPAQQPRPRPVQPRNARPGSNSRSPHIR